MTRRASDARFQPESLAGKGGMGEVWVARDDEVGRPVALKVIRADLADDERKVAAFVAEARLTARLDHPGVVPVHAVTETADGLPAYAMKLVRGRTLTEWVADFPPLQRRLEVFLKLCDALAYAHAAGVIHRDLKPDNVMIGDHGEVFAMDWGLASDAPPEDDDGLVSGTPHYMSPEQARADALDPRSDQYSLGLILSELVTLRPAMVGRDPLIVLGRAAAGRREPLVGAPPEIAAIVGRACALDREARYPDVTALADDVRRFLAGDAVLARPDTPWQAVRRQVGKHRELTLAVLASLVGLLVLTVLAAQTALHRAEQRADAERRRLADVQAKVAAQAARLDTRFAELEGLLGAIAAAAVDRASGTGEAAVFWADAGDRPPDSAPSPLYTGPVSFDHATFFAPAGVDRATLDAGRFATLSRPLRRALLASSGAAAWPADRAHHLLAREGTLIAYASIGFEDGLYLTYPGHHELPADYDARQRPWYTLALGEVEAQWGAPYVDASGLGILLPGSVALRDEGDRLLGVASIKIPFERLISGLLRAPDLPVGEVALLDEAGRVVVTSGQGSEAVVAPELLPYPEPSAGELVFSAKMPALGWTYALRMAP